MGFIEENFVQPIIQNGWFNPFNTLAYGAILIIGVILVYKLLEKLKIPIDRKFLLALLPFIAWAPVTRSLRDFVFGSIPTAIKSNPQFTTDLSYNLNAVYTQTQAHVSSTLPIPGIAEIYSSIVTWFVTPGSYLITTAIAFIVLMVSYGIQKKTKVPYWKTMFVIGLLILIGGIATLPIKSFQPLAVILSITIGLTAIFFVISKLVRNNPKLKKIFNYQNSGILGAHFLDASATFWALTAYGFVEQHVVPRLLFGFLGPISFFFLKAIVVIPVLYVFDTQVENPRMRNFLKVAVIILGLAPGLRDMTTLLLVG